MSPNRCSILTRGGRRRRRRGDVPARVAVGWPQFQARQTRDRPLVEEIGCQIVLCRPVFPNRPAGPCRMEYSPSCLQPVDLVRVSFLSYTASCGPLPRVSVAQIQPGDGNLPNRRR